MNDRLQLLSGWAATSRLRRRGPLLQGEHQDVESSAIQDVLLAMPITRRGLKCAYAKDAEASEPGQVELEGLQIDAERARDRSPGRWPALHQEVDDRQPDPVAERVRRRKHVVRKFEGISGCHTPSFADATQRSTSDSRILL